MPRWLRISVIALLAVSGLVVGGVLIASDPRPEAVPGEAADALARSLAAAAGGQGWEATGAVAWNFDGRHQLLWDRERGLVEVRWDDLRVLRPVKQDAHGLAFHEGEALTGTERREAVEKAYAIWANDSFWLNPLEKLFDEGVTRGLWEGPDGERGLLVRYASGGVTPGDAYLWLPGDDGLPRAWRMWVQIIPIGGLEATWEQWKTLATGARVSTLHRIAGLELHLEDVRAAHSLSALVGEEDPFEPLLALSR